MRRADVRTRMFTCRLNSVAGISSCPWLRYLRLRIVPPIRLAVDDRETARQGVKPTLQSLDYVDIRRTVELQESPHQAFASSSLYEEWPIHSVNSPLLGARSCSKGGQQSSLKTLNNKKSSLKNIDTHELRKTKGVIAWNNPHQPLSLSTETYKGPLH